MDAIKVKNYMSSAGCFGPEYQSVVILEDTGSPVALIMDISYIATKLSIKDCTNEAQVAKLLLDYMHVKRHTAFAFYTFGVEHDTFGMYVRFVTTDDIFSKRHNPLHIKFDEQLHAR